MAVKYVTDFSFPSEAGFSGSVKGYAKGGLIPDKMVGAAPKGPPMGTDRAPQGRGPKRFDDGGKVSQALADRARMTQAQNQATLDGIAKYASGQNKPGLLTRMKDAAVRANPKTAAALGVQPSTEQDDYAKGGMVKKKPPKVRDNYRNGGDVQSDISTDKLGNRPDAKWVGRPQGYEAGGPIGRLGTNGDGKPDSVRDNYKKGGLASLSGKNDYARGGGVMARSNLPEGKGSVQDPSIKAFRSKKRSRA